MKPPRLLSIGVLLLFLAIVLAPILYMFLTPLLGADGGWSGHGEGILHWRQLALAANSVGLAAGTTCVCLAIGVPFAFLITRTDLWGRTVFNSFYLVPLLVPPYLHAIVWSHLSRSLKPWLPLDIYTLWGAVFLFSLAYFPVVTLMTISGLKSVDRSLEEASLLHYGKWPTLARITLPLLKPHILSGAIFVFIFSIIDFAVPDILRVNVYPVEIFIQFSAFYNETGAMLLSLPLMAVTFSLVVLQRWTLKDRSYVNISMGASGGRTYRLGYLNGPTSVFCFLILGLAVVLPIGVLFEMAGALSNYVRVLKMSIEQMAYSFVLAGAGAAITLSLGFLLSYLIERSKAGMESALLFLVILPLAVPATILGIGLIKVWNRPLLDLVFESSLVVVFGYVARFIPFVVMTVTSGFKQLNPHLEEAAALVGHRWTRTMARVVIPLLRRGLMTGFFVVFILSLGELGTTLLVIPPGRETLPIKIYNLMHYGADQMVAALCLMLTAIIFTLSGLFAIFFRKFAGNRATGG